MATIADSDDATRKSGLTPEARSLRARMGAHAMHAKHDSRETSKPGREAFRSSFEKQVDPDGILEPAERARRAEHAKRAFYTGIALKSAQARRKSS